MFTLFWPRVQGARLGLIWLYGGLLGCIRDCSRFSELKLYGL